MAYIERPPDSIRWHEGMLLAPQHFQQQTLRFDQQMRYHATALSAFHYGVVRFSLERTLLVNGFYRVEDLEAVMPDGLIVSYAGEGPNQLELDLTAKADELKQNPGTVWLAVPELRLRTGGFNPENPRYHVVEGHTVIDADSGDGELRIPRLVPRMQLFMGDEPPSDYTAFPLSRVAYRDEAFELTPFLPPTLSLRKGHQLHKDCSWIAKSLREIALEQSERARGDDVSGGSGQLLEPRIRLSYLTAFLPHLEAVLRSGEPHPYDAYAALAAVLGPLSGVGRTMIPPVVPAYNHNDLRACFSKIIEQVQDLLAQGFKQPYSKTLMDRIDGGFEVVFDEGWAGRQVVLGVRGPPNMARADIVQWVNKARVGAKSDMPRLADLRVLGVGREALERDEQIIASADTVLFMLDKDSEHLKANEVLQVINITGRGAGPSPFEIVVYVKDAA